MSSQTISAHTAAFQSWQDQEWQTFFAKFSWNNDGLLPAIAQQFDSLEVLMQAWMNRESLRESLVTGQVCYWSRSRGKLWRKGEISGQTQRLIALRLDCDNDCLLLLVNQQGPACHTGRRSCFFNELIDGEFKIIHDPLIDPKILYAEKKSS